MTQLADRHNVPMSWLPWQEAWGLALYGTDGFYRRPEGPAGHFATSAHGLGPTGALLAEAVLELARRHALDRIVEVGAGRGELLTVLDAASGSDGPSLTGLDVVPRPAGLSPTVAWQRSPGGPHLPDELAGLTGTLALAHEWLDVVPTPVAERDDSGVWRVVEVDTASGRERRADPVPEADGDWISGHVPPGPCRVEVGRTRDLAFADLASRVASGLVLAVDYGHTRADRPAGGTLAAYRLGARVVPVPDGSCDLTAHVAVDTLGADRLVPQREALRDLLGVAPPPPHDLSRADPAAYLAALSRRSAVATLCAPQGPGGFWWAMRRRGRVRLN